MNLGAAFEEVLGALKDRQVLKAWVLVLVIIYLVPFPIYSVISYSTGLEPPSEDVLLFMLGVLIVKVGMALLFVLIYQLAIDSFKGRWQLYGLLWFLMGLVGEVGTAIQPDYGWLDALGGIVSEAVYFPLAAYCTDRLLVGTDNGPRPKNRTAEG